LECGLFCGTQGRLADGPEPSFAIAQSIAFLAFTLLAVKKFRSAVPRTA
jgi:hypothetical protein